VVGGCPRLAPLLPLPMRDFVVGGCPRLAPLDLPLDLPWPLAGVAALMGIELRSIGPGNFARKIEESFAAGDFAPTLSEDPDP
jgi:hypothetical protein